MKRILFILIAMGTVFYASAQRGHKGGHVVRVRPPIVVGGGAFFSPFYSPWRMGWGPGFYSPYYPMYSSRPSKLDMKIEDIKDEYQDLIKATRKDKSIDNKELKQIISDLKKDREEDIKQARKDYYESAFQRRSNS